jgi:hypothetical protein
LGVGGPEGFTTFAHQNPIRPALAENNGADYAEDWILSAYLFPYDFPAQSFFQSRFIAMPGYF